MLVIALLAILGSLTNAGVGYWIVYSLYCFFWLVQKAIDLSKGD